MKTAKEQAEELLGRTIDVVKVNDGYVVEYFNFNTTPPPVGDTEEKACILFLDWYKLHGNYRSDPESDTELA